MRESLGGSALLYLVVIFSSLVILFFIGILSYSKAYRIKNRIVEITEKYGTYNEAVVNEINPDLKAAGYDASRSNRCDDIKNRLENEKYGDNLSDNLNTYGYNYCVFEVLDNNINGGNYYVIVTFVRFEFPFIGDLFMIPVHSETKILGKDYSY